MTKIAGLGRAADRGAGGRAGRDRARAVLRDAARGPRRRGDPGRPAGRASVAGSAGARRHQPRQAARSWSTSSTRAGAEVVLRLAAAADALIEGYRPGVAERLGVGPRRLPGAQPAAGLRADDRLGPGRPAGRPRPATTSTTSRSPGRCTRSAGPAARRRCRSTTWATSAAGRCSWRSAWWPALLAARSSGAGQVVDAAIVDGAAVLQAMTYGPARGRHLDRRARRQPARHRRAVLRRLRDRRRPAHGGRRARAAVLRGVHPAAVRARGGAGRSARPSTTGPAGRSCGRGSPPGSPSARRRSGQRHSAATDACVAPVLHHDRGTGRPAPGRARHAT